MKVEVQVTSWEEIDLIEALETHAIAWSWDVITGHFAEAYYPAEKDDIFLEISQEVVNKYDGSINNCRMIWLECSSLIPQGSPKQSPKAWSKLSKQVVLKYIKDNIHRAMDIDKTGGHW